MDNKNNIARYETEMSKVRRPGMDKLLEYIRKSDFYTAPASTRFHLSCEGGLLLHSLNMLDALRGSLFWNGTAWEYKVAGKAIDTISDESLILIALTHDLCKTYFYGTSTRNQKNDKTGKWEKVPFYTVNDRMPIGGHGFKSAFLVKEYIKLTSQEFYAIRWHMGFTDAGDEVGTFRAALAKYPIVWAVHTADMAASTFMEAEAGNREPFAPAEQAEKPAEAPEGKQQAQHKKEAKERQEAPQEAQQDAGAAQDPEPEYQEAQPINETEEQLWKFSKRGQTQHIRPAPGTTRRF